MIAITTLFVDLGGVLVTGFWDRVARHRAVEQFDLDADDFQRRHELVYGLHEEGRLTLDEYLNQVVFHAQPSCSVGEFRQFICSQVQPVPEMLEFVRTLKVRHGLRVLLVGNGGRELTRYVIQDLELQALVDFFVCSCFVGRRKPDPALYQMALDLSQVRAEEVVCLEGHPLFARAAKRLGLRAVQHFSFQITRDLLASEGLTLEP